MLFRSFIIICLLFGRIEASGQAVATFIRDTSFNIQATFEKEKKKHPYITVANPAIPKTVIVKRDVIYRSIGDRQLSLDIYYPGNIKSAKTAVLLIFGGGWRSGDKTHNHAIATELARQGYVAVSAEYRLSPEAKYPAAVHDLKAAVRWMRAHAKQYGIDENEIAALGCSAGGQLAALLGTTNGDAHFEDKIRDKLKSSNVQAVIDIDGTLAFHHPESVEGKVAAEWLGGTYEQQPQTWTEAAPLEHVDKNTAPFLFINSSIPRFHAGREDMIRKMSAFGIYSEVHTLEDTPHPFWFFNPWFEPMMGHIVGFLKQQFQ